MNIYSIASISEAWSGFGLLNPQSYDALDRVPMTPAPVSGWEAPALEIFRAASQRTVSKLPQPEMTGGLGDLVCFATGLFVASEKARLVLEPIIGESAEFLPALVPEQSRSKYYLIHALAEFDAIDHDNMFATYYGKKSQREILAIERFAFKPEIIENTCCFRVIGVKPYCGIYVCQQVVDAAIDNALVGFVMRPCWSDEYEVGNVWPYGQPEVSTEPHKQRPVRESPLTQEEMVRKDSYVKHAREMLRIDPSVGADDASISGAIESGIRDIQKNHQRLLSHELAQLYLHVGCLWGECIAVGMSWRWSRISRGKSSVWALVSPNAGHFVVPINCAKDAMALKPKTASLSELLVTIRSIATQKSHRKAYSMLGNDCLM